MYTHVFSSAPAFIYHRAGPWRNKTEEKEVRRSLDMTLPRGDTEGSQMLEKKKRKKIVGIFITIHLSGTSIYKAFSKQSWRLCELWRTEIISARNLRFRGMFTSGSHAPFLYICCSLFLECPLHLSIHQIPIHTTRASTYVHSSMVSLIYQNTARYNHTTLCI